MIVLVFATQCITSQITFFCIIRANIIVLRLRINFYSMFQPLEEEIVMFQSQTILSELNLFVTLEWSVFFSNYRSPFYYCTLTNFQLKNYFFYIIFAILFLLYYFRFIIFIFAEKDISTVYDDATRLPTGAQFIIRLLAQRSPYIICKIII